MSLPALGGRRSSKRQNPGTALCPSDVAMPGETVIKAKYFGHENCYYMAGDMNTYCQLVVARALQKRKDMKGAAKPKKTDLWLTVTQEGVRMRFGASGEATVMVPVRDIACMSLSPKGGSKLLKLGAIICRAPTQRRSSTGDGDGDDDEERAPPAVGELDLICHIFKPEKRDQVWDFYAAFERMLKNRPVTDPYLEWSKSNRADAKPGRKGDADPDAYAYAGPTKPAEPAELHALMKHFSEPDVIDQVQEAYAKPAKLERRDSDIDVSFSDLDDDNDDHDNDDDDAGNSEAAAGPAAAGPAAERAVAGESEDKNGIDDAASAGNDDGAESSDEDDDDDEGDDEAGPAGVTLTAVGPLS